MLVKEFMSKNPIYLFPEQDIKVAFNILTDHRVRQAPVMEVGKLVGIVTDRDIRVALAQSLNQTSLTVKSVMTQNPDTVKDETDIADAARLLCKASYNALPVLNSSSELVGILTTTDILKGMITILDEKNG